MGGEFGQWREWTEERSLDWHLLEEEPKHNQLQHFVRVLNEIYISNVALYEDDYSWEGFYWLDLHDAQRSVLSFARHSTQSNETIFVCCNFTPIVRHGYRLGVPDSGRYGELLNSDSAAFGGSNLLNKGFLESQTRPWHDQPHSIEFTLPPLAVVYLKRLED